MPICHDPSNHSFVGVFTFLDGYYNTVQALLDWFEVDLGCTELLFIQIDLCLMCVFVLYSPDISYSRRNNFCLFRLICVLCVFLFFTPQSHSPLVLSLDILHLTGS